MEYFPVRITIDKMLWEEGMRDEEFSQQIEFSDKGNHLLRVTPNVGR